MARILKLLGSLAGLLLYLWVAAVRNLPRVRARKAARRRRRLADARQRVADEHVHHAAAAERGREHDRG